MSCICTWLRSCCSNSTPPVPPVQPVVHVIPSTVPQFVNPTPSSSSGSKRVYPQSITYPTSSVFSKCYWDNTLETAPFSFPFSKESSLEKKDSPSIVHITGPERRPMVHLKVGDAYRNTMESKSPRDERSFLLPPGSGPVAIVLDPSNSLPEVSRSFAEKPIERSHSPNIDLSQQKPKTPDPESDSSVL